MLSIPAPMILLALLLAAGTGALRGKVTLSGLAPRLAPLPVTRDMKVCGNNKPDESVEVSQGGGVRNAVIWLTDVPVPKDVKARKEKLDQQHCAFVPHVVVAPVGSTIDVINSDKALHNVRAQAGDVKLMNYAMPIPGHVVPTKLQKDGMFKVSCDVHPWMRAWLVVLERAAGDLWLSEVREARGATEKLERSGGSACIAWLRATPGAASRLEHLARALASEPGKAVAELATLGGSAGCSTR